MVFVIVENKELPGAAERSCARPVLGVNR